MAIVTPNWPDFYVVISGPVKGPDRNLRRLYRENVQPRPGIPSLAHFVGAALGVGDSADVIANPKRSEHHVWLDSARARGF